MAIFSESQLKTVNDLIYDTLKSVDLTIVSSQPLFEKYKEKTKKIKLIRHGADTSLFSIFDKKQVGVHKKLSKINGPIVGYYGALHKLNFDLIREVANERKNYNFVFVGPLSGPQGLKKKENVPNNVFYRSTSS